MKTVRSLMLPILMTEAESGKPNFTRLVRSAKLLSLIAVALLSIVAFAQEQKPGKSLAGYKAVMIEKVTVEKNAATEEFPVGYDAVLQKSAVANLLKKRTFEQVIDAAETASAEAAKPAEGQKLTLAMTVIKFDKGNRAARYMVGFGAGATKIKVRFVFCDAATGKELFRSDREGKFYGAISLVGGSKEHAVTEAAGDVIDGLIKDVNKNR
jgi:hypothetical protein